MSFSCSRIGYSRSLFLYFQPLEFRSLSPAISSFLFCQLNLKDEFTQGRSERNGPFENDNNNICIISHSNYKWNLRLNVACNFVGGEVIWIATGWHNLSSSQSDKRWGEKRVIPYIEWYIRYTQKSYFMHTNMCLWIIHTCRYLWIIQHLISVVYQCKNRRTDKASVSNVES